MKLREASEQVMGRLESENQQLQFDPSVILVIIEAIRVLLPMFVELCQKPIDQLPQTAGQMLEPVTLGERISYRMARRSLIRSLGWEDFQAAGGEKMLKALLQEAAGAEVDELSELWSSSFICGG